MKVAVLKIRQIEENPNALRTEVNRKNPQYLELKNSIAHYGLVDSISVREAFNEDGTRAYNEHGEEKFFLINGLHRKTVFQDLGMPEIPSNIMTLDEANMLAAQIGANAIRVETTKSQFAQAIKQQMQLTSVAEADIAAKNDKSVGWVRDQLSLNKLPKEALDLLDTGALNLSNAAALARLPGEYVLEYLPAATTESAQTFAPRIEGIVKELRAAAKEGRKANLNVFTPTASARKTGVIKEVYAELEQKGVSSVLAPVIEGKTNPVDVAKAVVAWFLQLDPASLEAQKAKFEAELAQKAADKAKKEEEKAAKKAAAEAKMAAPESAIAGQAAANAA